jgi:formylglycine-generating enzyme required for sulfatase activity
MEGFTTASSKRLIMMKTKQSLIQTCLLAAALLAVVTPPGSAQPRSNLELQFSAGQPSLSLTGTTGTVYCIQYIAGFSSTNVWVDQTLLQAQGATNFWTDPSAPLAGQRFYRAVSVAAPADTNLVFIQPGTFTMGSQTNEGGPGEHRQMLVTISRGFWIGKYLVTQGEYEAVVGNNPSFFTSANGYSDDPTLPVESVSWFDATNYCALRTQQEQAAGLIASNLVYRLPTEAEWEYACRAGTTTEFSYGDDPGYTNLVNYSWYLANSGGMSHPVGQKLPNPWGLYDVHGDVYEWCQDWLGAYPGGTALDPQGTDPGGWRGARGGGLANDAPECRSANRFYVSPFLTEDDLGFRLVLSLNTQFEEAQFTYTINNGAITITGYIGSGGTVSIPDTINGLPVTSIGDDAFFETALTSVTIPNSVTSIGDGAFEDCFSLMNAIVGNGVTSIGSDAFFNSSVTSVYFGGNAPATDSTSFGNNAATVYYLSNASGWSNTFAGRPTVMLYGPAQFGTTAGGLRYLSDQVKITLITGYAGSSGFVTIPNTINGLPVTGIGGFAFGNSSGLTDVTIPNSVTNIGDFAFSECSSLAAITVAAENPACSSLNGVLFEKNQTTLIQYPAGKTATGYIIPDSVTSIGDGAFFYSTRLKGVTIPNGVSRIGDAAFNGCSSLTNVTIPGSVTNIGESAFSECSSLTSVYFGGNAPSVSEYTFYGDYATAYYLPGTLGWSSNFAGLPTALWQP